MSENMYVVPPGKLRCVITDDFRNDTPEENVRQRWARSLMIDYGYPKVDIAIEYTIQMGSSKKRADLVIFKPGGKHLQENAIIIIETKRDDILSTDKQKGESQLKSYMAACVACKYGLWVGNKRSAFERTDKGEIINVTDIPRAGDERPRRPERSDLTPAHDLKAIFRRCHNYIHANGGWHKAEAFNEMLKLIFCKVYDEEETSGVELSFAIDPKEQRSESGKRRLLEDRIKPLFEKVKDRYPYIYSEDEQVKLDAGILAYIVSELQNISLSDTDMDVKGAAYEEIVGENLRGDRGEYFTPRNVSDMTVRMIQVILGNRVAESRVLDCCCGTGGFLVSWIDNLRKIFEEQAKERQSKKKDEEVKKRIREACSRYLYGLDINPFLVQTAQMNMVMHGDGSTNIFREDSSRSPGEWSDDTRKKVPYGKFDVVITNPPFGNEVRIDDPHVLSRYELTRWDTQNPRVSIPAEQLFIETAYNFLKPGGILGLVLPDGILNNPGLRFLRAWLLKHTRVIATIDLPKETFAANGGVNNPSVLILKKMNAQEIKNAEADIYDDNEVFMAIPKTCGIDKRGKSVFLRQPDGQEILDDKGNRIKDDQVSLVPKAFEEWYRYQRPIDM